MGELKQEEAKVEKEMDRSPSQFISSYYPFVEVWSFHTPVFTSLSPSPFY